MRSIELQESVVTRLSAQAKSEGLSLEAYLEKLAGGRSWEEASLPRITGDELDRLLDAEASGSTAYCGTYSRADIYFDHD